MKYLNTFTILSTTRDLYFCLTDVYIHDFHSKWTGAYDLLEYVHTYIQW